MRRLLVLLAPLCVAIPSVSGAAPADASALCAGWTGKWTAVQNTERQPGGSWKADLSDPDWQVDPIAPGKCRFSGIQAGKPERDELDTTSGSYVWTHFVDGKPVPPNPYRYTRSEITDARHWTIEISGTSKSAPKPYIRFTMVMADDSFFITMSDATSAAGPYTLQSYTAHQRRP